MESGVRKKRTLAERRESDKLRQRRFRAKKKEEALLLQVISGSVDKEKKERVYSLPKKTADEIRETNRIRQQRFRAKRREEEQVGNAIEEEDVMSPPEALEVLDPPPSEDVPILQEPEISTVLVQQILLQAASVEKNRQTEIRREKDRIRKRRERQRKKDTAMKLAGSSSDEIIKYQFQKKLEYLQKDMDRKKQMSNLELELDDEDEEEDQHLEDDADSKEDLEEEADQPKEFDASKFMEQLEEMGLILEVVNQADGAPTFDIKQKEGNSDEDPTTSSSSSSPNLEETLQELSDLPGKKPWQRCHSAEERRERERMRKRMYRAKQKFISTGRLEMQWDPTPIKRAPNDESEAGITPIPEWTSNLSSEQKTIAHRIYNKRYRERMKSSVQKRDHSPKDEESLDGLNLPSEVYSEILSTISQCDLTNLVAQHQSDE